MIFKYVNTKIMRFILLFVKYISYNINMKRIDYERLNWSGKKKYVPTTQKGYISSCVIYESLSKLSLSNQMTSKESPRYMYTWLEAKLAVKFAIEIVSKRTMRPVQTRVLMISLMHLHSIIGVFHNIRNIFFIYIINRIVKNFFYTLAKKKKNCVWWGILVKNAHC